MGFWKQIKTLLRGQTAERTDVPRKQEAETTPALETPPEPESAPRSHAETAGRQKKPIATSLAKLTLFFSGWGYDERKGKRTVRDYGKTTALLEADGKIFEARRIDEHVLFREYGDQDERACLFLKLVFKHDWSYPVTGSPPQAFAVEFAHGQYGRCLLYVAENMTPQQCAFLYFEPDGSGFAKDENWLPLAAFHWREATQQTWPDLLTSDPEQLRPLCKLLFETQINPRSRNPYMDPPRLEQIPHRFLAGSEAHLRLLTIAIVQTEPDLFKESLEPVTITYRAQTPAKRAGTTRIVQAKTQLTSGRITSLCDLTLRLNTFVGVEWTPRIPASNRAGDWEKQVHKVRVTVHPPSAHERAESLLILADWLEGKVREEKRLRLLGIED